MKLTPEQKSILAYGETRGILKERKSLMRFTEGSGEGRTCGNCENGYNYHRSSPCWKCLRNAAAEHYQFLFLQDNWEPRKEASND